MPGQPPRSARSSSHRGWCRFHCCQRYKFGHCPSLRIRAGGVGVTPTGEEVWRRGGLENLWEMQRFGYMAVVSAFGRRLTGYSQASQPHLSTFKHITCPPPRGHSDDSQAVPETGRSPYNWKFAMQMSHSLTKIAKQMKTSADQMM